MSGKICYIEIPTTDIDASARFYAKVFGWEIRTRQDGERAFHDPGSGVGGTWVMGRRLETEGGMVTYMMVDDIEAALGTITAAGGHVSKGRTPLDRGDAYATFFDPVGNLMGLYQQPR